MQGMATQLLSDALGPAPGNVAPTLLARARTLVASGKAEAARPLLAAVRRLGGDAEEADALECQLLVQAGRLDEALAILDPAIERRPGEAATRLLRAETRLLAGDVEGSVRDAAEAVIAEPGNVRAKATLGITLAELGCVNDAIPCLAEASRADPAHPGYRLALARAQEFAGDPDAAAATLLDGIALAPRHVPLRNAAVQLALARHDFAGAVELAEAARQVGVLDAGLFGLLGQALANLGRHPAAGEAYAEALKLAPENPYFRHMAASSGLLPPPPQAADGFVRMLFDAHANRFDQQLIKLDYRVPGLLRAAVQAHVRLPEIGRLGPVLDLGCGTGFVAVAMSDLPLGPWHGVDLSPAMLRQARAKGVYQALQEASLADALALDGEQDYALAVAGDVFCYIGALHPVLCAVHRRLRPGGWLFASVEALPPGMGWRLGPLGRYAHAPDHIAEVASAAGFTVAGLQRERLRSEGGEAVDGLILALAKAAS